MSLDTQQAVHNYIMDSLGTFTLNITGQRQGARDNLLEVTSRLEYGEKSGGGTLASTIDALEKAILEQELLLAQSNSNEIFTNIGLELVDNLAMMMAKEMKDQVLLDFLEDKYTELTGPQGESLSSSIGHPASPNHWGTFIENQIFGLGDDPNRSPNDPREDILEYQTEVKSGQHTLELQVGGITVSGGIVDMSKSGLTNKMDNDLLHIIAIQKLMMKMKNFIYFDIELQERDAKTYMRILSIDLFTTLIYKRLLQMLKEVITIEPGKISIDGNMVKQEFDIKLTFGEGVFMSQRIIALYFRRFNLMGRIQNNRQERDAFFGLIRDIRVMGIEGQNPAGVARNALNSRLRRPYKEWLNLMMANKKAGNKQQVRPVSDVWG